MKPTSFFNSLLGIADRLTRLEPGKPAVLAL